MPQVIKRMSQIIQAFKFLPDPYPLLNYARACFPQESKRLTPQCMNPISAYLSLFRKSS